MGREHRLLDWYEKLWSITWKQYAMRRGCSEIINHMHKMSWWPKKDNCCPAMDRTSEHHNALNRRVLGRIPCSGRKEKPATAREHPVMDRATYILRLTSNGSSGSQKWLGSAWTECLLTSLRMCNNKSKVSDWLVIFLMLGGERNQLWLVNSAAMRGQRGQRYSNIAVKEAISMP